MISPVIYSFFNRPELTRRTFTALRAQRPARLYLIADGPRPGYAADAARCAETRAVVDSLLDWPCEITRDYATQNLGYGQRHSTGLSAAFALLGEAVVLEENVLPHPDFFAFCDHQLSAHREDPHIHAISGFQPLGRYSPSRGPVVASTFIAAWGWASWQRAWRAYRFDVADTWNNPVIRQGVRDYLRNDLNFLTHACNFDTLARCAVDTWRYQWSLALFAQRRVTLVSSVNLVTKLPLETHSDPAPAQADDPEPYLKNLTPHAPVPTRRQRDTSAPDRTHDKLFGEVVHARSRFRLSLLRRFARHPLLARALLDV